MKTALPGLLEVMVVLVNFPRPTILCRDVNRREIRLLFCNQLVRFVTDSVTQVKDSSLSFFLIMFMRPMRVEMGIPIKGDSKQCRQAPLMMWLTGLRLERIVRFICLERW